jgi:hypothetical protein
MTTRDPTRPPGRPRRKWTDHEDDIISKRAKYGDNKVLAERFGCTEKLIASRRKTLMAREKETLRSEQRSKVVLEIPIMTPIKSKYVTERPTWFLEEDLDTLMRARR